MTTIWDNDTRYPAPAAFELPPFITGVPSQAELDAQPRLFTWGELKDVIQSGELDRLSRNKQLQHTYEAWMQKQRAAWGSTENYLVNARLPWGEAHRRHGVVVPPEPTYDQRTALSHPEVDLVPSTRPRGDGVTPKHRRVVSSEAGAGAAAVAAHALGLSAPAPSTPASCSHAATAPSSRGSSDAGSGASSPSSVAYVSLESVLPKVNRRLERARARRAASDSGSSREAGEPEGDREREEEDDDDDVYLKYDAAAGLDSSKYALLPNDWPYCVPYGVRHYCVWSRVPIAHPVLVDYERGAWAKIEAEGLGGFTGVIPHVRLPTPAPEAAAAAVAGEGPAAAAAAERDTGAAAVSGRACPDAGGEGWYAVDVRYAGAEVRRWAGVEYEAKGGHEVAKMVRGLFDPRGFETLWFVNPPRLQSVPGYAHFHVFARRKTPTEIDVSEKVWNDKGERVV
ncbi:hypothetical protein CC85DRAFT_329197 [Cutaneotrichosporon oleaginosum]|uniref:Uncharacterized protein n=1 Tax=Cutaneotrichosporon oleaginosum TaxID=879819 RepID=A0A0J1B149_9TREE|nr:uncharacterized protein CC85DRAFT_329197 [Cutaneotrichosporon oleaginosum]KLT41324.1 hypothetical protein CC85DRAFT_329197 [Cutaneotrichosporon oleaginosum]TXT14074.1 hypothetical protein COLE_00267 [Cutaneotrichosporon oleaginosum]